MRASEPAVAATFAEADEVMTPLLGRPLTDVIFVDPASPERMADAEEELRRTEITQPAVLAVDIALTRLLGEYGIAPDMVMGHSLGEYGALVAAGSLSFAAALEAVSARGHEMANLTIDDAGSDAGGDGAVGDRRGDRRVDRRQRGRRQRQLDEPIGDRRGHRRGDRRRDRRAPNAGLTTARLPVSHAFHTSIVAPVSEPLRRVARTSRAAAAGAADHLQCHRRLLSERS